MPGSAYVAVRPMSEILAANIKSWRREATMFVAFGAQVGDVVRQVLTEVLRLVMVARLIPAIRAARLDPSMALCSERGGLVGRRRRAAGGLGRLALPRQQSRIVLPDTFLRSVPCAG